ncbi:MAG: response regulator [Magnetococcales bacterium]|nr:response regulator [Magnetococcales bacterium]MBF0321659.1 response regulator [Magnetococcales bacterium]
MNKPGAQATCRARVFVVDDTETNIDLLVETLGEEYDVGVALDGVSALDDIVASHPDLILLDVMMPGMDGYEVCRRLKKDPQLKDIPLIFITARNEVDDQTHGFGLGAVDFITKPFSPPVVQARVRTHIQLKRAREALADQNRILEERVRERTSDLQRRTEELASTRLEIIRRLGRAAEFKDNETGLHVIRMSHYCRTMAPLAGLSTEEADLLFQSAPMHDIGKIGIPDHILLKPEALTSGELQIMRRHPEIGAGIIGQHDSILLETARQVALTHHEKWNGSGYPRGLAGQDIPMVGRITAVADVFDALTSMRPYKAPWSVEKTLAWMQEEKGRHFDPSLIDHFMQILPDILLIHERWKERDHFNPGELARI